MLLNCPQGSSYNAAQWSRSAHIWGRFLYTNSSLKLTNGEFKWVLQAFMTGKKRKILQHWKESFPPAVAQRAFHIRLCSLS